VVESMRIPLLMRLVIAMLAVVWLLPSVLIAQDDASEIPLGDIARSFHKKPSSNEVIDNDNLSKVMDQEESRRFASSALRYSIDAAGKSFQVSAPDVTCRLSFSANAQALLSRQYAQFDLPTHELGKLAGRATIEGDSLQVSIFNGTDWHLSEVAVAVTLLRKTFASDAAIYFGTSQLLAAMDGASSTDAGHRPEKRSDATFLYRMRAAGPPSTVTVFRAPLNVEIGPDQEWHWAIVQAKGYPPERTDGAASASSQSMPARSEPVPADGSPSTSTILRQPN
jgi:hypothetical protein